MEVKGELVIQELRKQLDLANYEIAILRAEKGQEKQSEEK